MSISLQVLYDVIIKSHDIFEEQASQNAVKMKLGRQILERKVESKVERKVSQRVLDDVILPSNLMTSFYCHFIKQICQNAMNMNQGTWQRVHIHAQLLGGT